MVNSMASNVGKDFENDVKSSVSKDVYFQRMNDSATSWIPNARTQFTPNNPYDFFAFYNNSLFCLELKSTKHTSLTFWREDFEDKTKKQTFMIRKNQIQGLQKASTYKNVFAGFLINFRDVERTYWVNIIDFLKYTDKEKFNKKSVNEDDFISMGALCIPQEKKRVHYRYDIKLLFNELIKSNERN